MLNSPAKLTCIEQRNSFCIPGNNKTDSVVLQRDKKNPLYSLEKPGSVLVLQDLAKHDREY